MYNWEIPLSPPQPTERELAEVLQFLQLMPVAVLRLGESGVAEMLNPKAVQLLTGLNIFPGEADGPMILDALHPGLAATWRATHGKAGQVMPPLRCDFPHKSLQLRHLVVYLVRPDVRCTMLTIEDVTAAVEQERELDLQRQRLGTVLEHIRGYCVAMLDVDGVLTESNPSIGSLFGTSSRHGVGEPLLNWLASDVGTTLPPDFESIKATVARQGWFRLYASWRAFDGHLLWCDCIVTPVVWADGSTGSFMAIIRDLTDEHWRKHPSIDAVLKDPLTGLYNRRGLEQCVEARIHGPDDSPRLQSWIMLDVDHFKAVNDAAGYDGGDAVLRSLATVLKAAGRADDILVRTGGGEFVLLLPRVTAASAVQLAERLRLRVAGLVATTGARELRITASFGVAEQTPGEPWHAALARANAALYLAKQEGRDRVMLASAQQFSAG